MAKIKINEVDNSSVSVETGLEHIVYIPGYAIKGPSNTPTLCTSLSEFKSKFGNLPYVYKNDQYFDGTASSPLVAKAGDYEKSYLYAVELLRQGLPVLFERIVSNEGHKATLRIQFRDKVRVAVFNKESLVYTAVNTSLSTDSWVLYDSNNEEVADAILVENVEALSLTASSVTAELEEVESPIHTEDGETNENNYLDITAKFVGSYGTDIKVSIEELTDGTQYPISDERLFELYINDARYVVNFDATSDYYVVNRLASNEEVDVSLTVSSEYLNTNLYGIINKENANLEYISDSGDEMSFAAVRTILAASETASTPSPYYALSDVVVYDVKFITSGAYYSMDANDNTIASLMLNCAAGRGDALAVIDIAKGISKNSYLSLVDTAFPTAYVDGEDRNKFGTIIAPNVKVVLQSTQTAEWMPASFAYLYALASSVKDNPVWFAVSGVVRGAISNFREVEFVVDEGTANAWQSETSISINPIQNVRPYGYCIYGNRTLYRNLEGLINSSFTNVRVLVNEAKKVTRKAINRLMFESNDSVLWNNFKSLVEPTLEQMRSGRGIRDYKIIRLNTNKKATVSGLIKIMPIEAIENFEITFSLEDSTVVVE